MSHELDKLHHSERLHQKEKKLSKKLKLAKEYGYKHVLKNPHRYHKSSVFNCGNSNCMMCGNPRKFWKEKTMQEQRFEQKELHED